MKETAKLAKADLWFKNEFCRFLSCRCSTGCNSRIAAFGQLAIFPATGFYSFLWFYILKIKVIQIENNLQIIHIFADKIEVEVLFCQGHE